MIHSQQLTIETAVDLSVVIPCFNEVDGIAELHRRVTAACISQAGISYEIVLVIDGPTDGTREAILALAATDPHVFGLDLARNYGHQIALTAGLEFCRGRRVLILDADLQDPPELLGPMMAKMDEGFDVVYGQREKRDGETWFKLASASLFYRLLRGMVDVEMAAHTGDFRLMSRRAVDFLNSMPERYRFIRGMVSWIGLPQAAFPYHRHARFAGKTQYPFKKMLLLAVDAMTSFSVVPLRIASLIGALFGVLGLVALAHALFAWTMGHVIPGWTSLAALILVIGSAQLMMLGVFGEYLGRMYMETKRRPLYLVRDIVSSRQSAEAGTPHVHRLQEMVRKASRAAG